MSVPTQEVGRLEGHTGGVLVAKFNSNGKYCVTGGKDRLVNLWNPHTQLLIKTYKGHGFEVTDVSTSSDNSHLASCGADKMAIIWDVSTGRIVRKVRAHNSRINCLLYCDENDILATGSYDSTVKLWDLKSSMREPIQTLPDARDSITSLDVTSVEVLTASVDGHTRLYDLRVGQMYDDQHSDAVTSARFSNDKNCTLVTTLDSTVRLIDKDNGSMLAKYTGHENSNYQVQATMSYDDAHVWCGSESGHIYCWELVNASVVTTIKAGDAVISSLSYHPKKHCLLSASTGGAVQIWRPQKKDAAADDDDKED